MKADQLTPGHLGATLITGRGSKRRRGKLVDLDLRPFSFVLATIDYPARGVEMVALPFDTDIEIEV